jgi:predicted dehydrogenase
MARRQNTRRDFLRQGALAGVGYWVAGGVVIGDEAKKLANDKINVASIGVGGKGQGDTEQAARLGNCVALCDVDDLTLGKMGEKFPQAEKFNDFRKMFDKLAKSIDAVTVSTPDHTHAPASVMAMRLKKHVYCQKPLTHTVYEARQMRLIAKEMGVATQMGNQGTAADGLRRAVEFVQAGGIGAVKEAHVWTNRPIWPQAPTVTKRPNPEPVPPHVHWDEFLGPAPERPYAKGYHPFAWRGWWDFGTGALGDMACHTANMAFMALKLQYPTSIQAENGEINPETYPAWARITFQFPAGSDQTKAGVKFMWYEGKTPDGKNVLPAADLVKGQAKRETGNSIYFFDQNTAGADQKKPDFKWHFSNGKNDKVVASGSFLIGEKGTLFSPDDYGAESYIVTPGSVEKLTGKPEKMASNNRGDQGMKDEWAQAIRGGPVAYSNFDYAAMLTETILLGNVAMRAGGKLLEWNGRDLKITNEKDANKFLHYEYRKGWTL